MLIQKNEIMLHDRRLGPKANILGSNQTLSNLTQSGSNSIKFSQNGEITITVSTSLGIVFIKDEGRGMSAKTQRSLSTICASRSSR